MSKINIVHLSHVLPPMETINIDIYHLYSIEFKEAKPLTYLSYHKFETCHMLLGPSIEW